MFGWAGLSPNSRDTGSSVEDEGSDALGQARLSQSQLGHSTSRDGSSAPQVYVQGSVFKH